MVVSMAVMLVLNNDEGLRIAPTEAWGSSGSNERSEKFGTICRRRGLGLYAGDEVVRTL